MSPFRLMLVFSLLATPAFALETVTSVDMSDVDQRLGALQAQLKNAETGGRISAAALEPLRGQETILETRVAKVKAEKPVTPSEHTALLAAIETQEGRLQRASAGSISHPARATVGMAPVTGTSPPVVGEAAASYGSTTTIGPNGAVILSNGPVVNGTPVGPAVAQPAFPNNAVAPDVPAPTGVYGPSLGRARANEAPNAPPGTYGPSFDKSGQETPAAPAPAGTYGPSLGTPDK